MQLINKGRILRTFDKDALAIINTIRDVDGIILTQDERWYVNHIVSGFKAIGVWTKIKALYGFVGGTAATHKWNWKDMRDLDAAYRLTWNGTIIHNVMGVKGDGISGYAETYLAPSSFTANMSLGVYSFSNITSTNFPVDIGSQNNTNPSSFSLTFADENDFTSARAAINSFSFNNISHQNTIGFFGATKVGTTVTSP